MPLESTPHDVPTPAAPALEPVSGARLARLFGLFAASFLAVSLTASGLMPRPAGFSVSEKMAYLEEHIAKYDAVFVGSSMVWRSFAPRVIDKRLAERGISLRSFNLGGEGMKGYEIDDMLASLLEFPGQQLRFVFIEPRAYDPFITKRNRFTERSVWWHSTEQTLSAIDAAWGMDGSLVARLNMIQIHLRLFGWRQTAYGQGARILKDLLGHGPASQFADGQMDTGAGFQGMSSVWQPGLRAAGQRHRADPNEYLGRLRQLRADLRKRFPAEIWHLDAQRRQLERLTAAGIRVIYVMPPNSITLPVVTALHEEGHLPELLRFDQPDAYPELYELERRYDVNHLTTEAAVLFSRLFADQIVELLEEEG